MTAGIANDILRQPVAVGEVPLPQGGQAPLPRGTVERSYRTPPVVATRVGLEVVGVASSLNLRVGPKMYQKASSITF